MSPGPLHSPLTNLSPHPQLLDMYIVLSSDLCKAQAWVCRKVLQSLSQWEPHITGKSWNFLEARGTPLTQVSLLGAEADEKIHSTMQKASVHTTQTQPPHHPLPYACVS